MEFALFLFGVLCIGLLCGWLQSRNTAEPQNPREQLRQNWVRLWTDALHERIPVQVYRPPHPLHGWGHDCDVLVANQANWRWPK